jgi:hypothetical protein
MTVWARIAAAAAFLALCGTAQAQILASRSDTAVFTRDQVRERLTDQCMMSEGSKASPSKSFYGECSCYGRGVAKLMKQDDIAAFTKARQVPGSIHAEAVKVFERCVK